jgi:transposase-like protein
MSGNAAFRSRASWSNAWQVDETYVKIRGSQVCLCRAVDWAGRTVDYRLSAGRCCRSKVFFAMAIRSQGLAPETITLDGFAASHRVAREMKVEGLLPEEITLKSSMYLKNRIGRNHRNVKSRVDVMLGFKRFRDSTVTISGIELMHRIRHGPLGLTDVRLTHTLPRLSTG